MGWRSPNGRRHRWTRSSTSTRRRTWPRRPAWQVDGPADQRSAGGLALRPAGAALCQLDSRLGSAHHAATRSSGEDGMRAFLASVVVAIVVAVGAMFALDAVWRPADQAFATSGARVGDAGDNLVGKDWYSSRRF